MEISIITDEISADFETAVELGTSWGVRSFELRGYFTNRAPNLSAYQKQCVRDVLDEYGARMVAIGPGLFKIPYPASRPSRATLGWMDLNQYTNWTDSQKLLDYHQNELLPASLDYASELGANLVVIFSFERKDEPTSEPPEEVLNCLQQAAERAKAQNIVLAIETEAGYWADTGAHTAQILRLIDNPALRVNWDPGNAFFAGDIPYPAGYLEVREFVHHVHYKDARRDRFNTPQYVAEGQIDWAGQVKQLVEDSYGGFISIETHLSPKVAAARDALERLRGFIATAQA
jgi:sugar phosphate isomerase/epimerase